MVTNDDIVYIAERIFYITIVVLIVHYIVSKFIQPQVGILRNYPTTSIVFESVISTFVLDFIYN